DFRRLVVVGDGNPAFAAIVADAARSAPALALQDHFDAVGILDDHAVAGFIVDVGVGDSRGVAGADGHLTLSERVRAPFADATGVKIIVAAPAAFDIFVIVRPFRTGPQPQIPIHFILGRLGLLRQE